MKQHNPEVSKNDLWVFPDSVPSRPDSASAEIVEKGVALQNVHGTDYAAEFLKFNGIRMDVAVRVLCRPTDRRGYDQ